VQIPVAFGDISSFFKGFSRLEVANDNSEKNNGKSLTCEGLLLTVENHYRKEAICNYE